MVVRGSASGGVRCAVKQCFTIDTHTHGETTAKAVDEQGEFSSITEHPNTHSSLIGL